MSEQCFEKTRGEVRSCSVAKRNADLGQKSASETLPFIEFM